MSQPPIISLVIPAYNEEDAVASTLRRAVEAAAANPGRHGLAEVEVLLVNDGSHDKTFPLACGVPGVRVVSYDRNRGYGKAIETGYAAARGDYLAFMDADGTCDPNFLYTLWDHLHETNADIVLGCRMHRESKMPRVRRLGNTLYAWLLSAIAGQGIRDTASGMRLLKRDLLPRILPLPAGLSYTPSMSARCVLDPGITIAEVDMPYEERTGESKLHVVRDGLRFLQTIMVTAVFYTPLRIFGALTALLVALVATWHVLFGSPGELVRAVLPTLVLGSGLGLFFHFFSKAILPTWPTGPVERVLDRLMHPGLLTGVGVAGFLAAGFTCPAFRDWLPATWTVASVALLLAAGRLALHQMTRWQQRNLPVEDLLRDTVVVDAASPGGPEADAPAS